MTILYHGSKMGITGRISPFISRELCDFGQGFYTGDNIVQAQTIASEGKNPMLYEISVDLSDLRVYTFTSDIEWMLYVGVKRMRIDADKYPKLKELCEDIDGHDVIVGLIADDRMAASFTNFLDGVYTDAVLAASLKFVKLGNQYVFKTEKACSKLMIIKSMEIQLNEAKELQRNKRRTIAPLLEQIEDVYRANRRNGRFIDELLEDYK